MKTSSSPTFGAPTPLGLLGLSIGCAALLPIAFGRVPHDPASAAMMFQTCAGSASSSARGVSSSRG